MQNSPTSINIQVDVAETSISQTASITGNHGESIGSVSIHLNWSGVFSPEFKADMTSELMTFLAQATSNMNTDADNPV